MKLLQTLLIMSVISPMTMSAINYYVGPTGNDTNSGLSLVSAFRTLQKAANTVAAGDLVLVSDSTYAGFYISTSGTAANPIIFKANGSQVIINRRNATTPDGINIEGADWIIIDGFTVINQPRAGIRAALSDHVTVKNNHCLNNQRWGIFTGFTDDFTAEYNECAFSVMEHGIYVSNSSDRAIVRYNSSHDNRAAGLHFNGDISQGPDGINHDPQVYNNIIYENGIGGGAAINMDGNQNALIYNNLLYNNHASGIALFQIDGGGPSTGARVYHNTIVQATSSRWGILLVDGAMNATIKNNIIINQHATRGAINVDAASRPGLVSDYNILTNRFTFDDANTVIDSTQWRSQGYDQHSYFSPNPATLFSSFAANVFTLPPGSIAINFGTNTLSPAINFDLLDQSRPQGLLPDAGAYETNNSPLPLHWISASSVVQHDKIIISGEIAEVDNSCSICLYKWNKALSDYKKIECKSLDDPASSVSIYFEQAPGPGTHQYKMVAREPDGQDIDTKDLYALIKPKTVILAPNPTIDIIRFTGIPDLSSIRVYDMKGTLLPTRMIDHDAVDLSPLAAGIYLIRILSPNDYTEHWVQKL